MGSPAQVPVTQTTPYWTEEKHVHFLNTMESSFVRTMLHNNHHLFLRLDRHLPDTSDSTLDLKPHHHHHHHYRNRRRTTKLHAPSGRRTRRRSSQPFDSSQDQVVPQAENEREVAAGDCHGDKIAEN